jgi:hypothetical protein
MIKINGTDYLNQRGIPSNAEKKAIMLTGAHHSRELVSVQMPLYVILDLLHGLVHGDPETLEILKRNQVFVIPIVNVDGSNKIYDHYMQTGELLLKRKNMDRSNEKGIECPLAEQGVDINRNYGYLWSDGLSPCDESYAGPHAFSEPESKAMRANLIKYQDLIKFVYNFHAFGPMYIWPYNGELDNELAKSNPEAQKIFNEIWESKLFPTSTISGNAMKTVGYKATGEANDYILKAFNIPSVSPELGNDNIFSTNFFLPYDFVTREVLRDNHPWIKHTIEKLGGELSIEPKSQTVTQTDSGYDFHFKVRNSGLQDWNLGDEGVIMQIGKGAGVRIPNLKARQSQTISFSVPENQVSWDSNNQIKIPVTYLKLAVKVNSPLTTESIVFNKPMSSPSSASLLALFSLA